MLRNRFQFAKAIVAAPPSLAPTFLQIDLRHALSPKNAHLHLCLSFHGSSSTPSAHSSASASKPASSRTTNSLAPNRPSLGFISYPIIKLFSGKAREIGWLTYLLALVLLAYFLLLRSRLP